MQPRPWVIEIYAWMISQPYLLIFFLVYFSSFISCAYKKRIFLKDSVRNYTVSVASDVQLSLLAIQLQSPLPPPALNSSHSASSNESSRWQIFTIINHQSSITSTPSRSHHCGNFYNTSTWSDLCSQASDLRWATKNLLHHLGHRHVIRVGFTLLPLWHVLPLTKPAYGGKRWTHLMECGGNLNSCFCIWLLALVYDARRILVVFLFSFWVNEYF